MSFKFPTIVKKKDQLGSPRMSLPSAGMIPGARFSKVPRTFRARKAIRKTTNCLFGKAGLLICCKENKNKNNCTRRLRFEDTKRIMSPEICPRSFGTFEKQAPALRFYGHPLYTEEYCAQRVHRGIL